MSDIKTEHALYLRKGGDWTKSNRLFVDRDRLLAAADHIEQQAKRIEELEAIVARLPVTADGVVMAPESVASSIVFNKQGHMGSLHYTPDLGWIAWPTCELGLMRRTSDDEAWPVPPEWCYSTQEAAEMSKAKEPK